MNKQIKRLHSAGLDGVEAFSVEIEASFTKGLPNFSIVGLGDEAIRESKERIKSALLLNEYTFPPLRITVSLAPSDRSKRGSLFDLPIALLIGLDKQEIDFKNIYCFGELGLDGKVRSTSSLFGTILSLSNTQKDLTVLVPKDVAKTVASIYGITVYGVDTLAEAIEFFVNKESREVVESEDLGFNFLDLDEKYFYVKSFEEDFKEVKGQTVALRSALIAATGFHNILFSGSPGSGKSMITKRLRYILPPLSRQEILEIAMAKSLNSEKVDLTPIRPFKNPHHSSTKASIFGGGSRGAKIGEISNANRGILWFDELPHFGKSTLESLREPMEDKKLLISRVNSKVEYKTDFLFVGAMNPCPCGNLLSDKNLCRCSDMELQRYKNRLSDPFLDRIDLFIEMRDSDLNGKSTTTSKEMFEKVLKAFQIQKERGQKVFNSRIEDRDLEQFCKLSSELENFLNGALEKFGISMRGRGKVLRVARTIADLDNKKSISKSHILEALSYRKRS
ncbi:MAG: YifB family Mg chelatase-like AAA ATPase [Campylobacterales bacterium]|nr:YifB family Mg chelatase-like AAA ATPase [Campylobacterales bacterium]